MEGHGTSGCILPRGLAHRPEGTARNASPFVHTRRGGLHVERSYHGAPQRRVLDSVEVSYEE